MFKELNIGDKFHPEDDDWIITIQDIKDDRVYYNVYWKISPNGNKHVTTDIVSVTYRKFMNNYYKHKNRKFMNNYYKHKMTDVVTVPTNFFEDELFTI